MFVAILSNFIAREKKEYGSRIEVVTYHLYLIF